LVTSGYLWLPVVTFAVKLESSVGEGGCVSVGWLDVFIASLTGRVFRGGIHTVDFCGQTWVSVDNGGQR